MDHEIYKCPWPIEKYFQKTTPRFVSLREGILRSCPIIKQYGLFMLLVITMAFGSSNDGGNIAICALRQAFCAEVCSVKRLKSFGQVRDSAGIGAQRRIRPKPWFFWNAPEEKELRKGDFLKRQIKRTGKKKIYFIG